MPDEHEHQCRRCGYKWEQRFPGHTPRQCPHCKSPKWDEPLKRIPASRKKPVQGTGDAELVAVS